MFGALALLGRHCKQAPGAEMPARAAASGIQFVFFVRNAAEAPRRHRHTGSAGAPERGAPFVGAPSRLPGRRQGSSGPEEAGPGGCGPARGLRSGRGLLPPRGHGSAPPETGVRRCRHVDVTVTSPGAWRARPRGAAHACPAAAVPGPCPPGAAAPLIPRWMESGWMWA